MRLLILAVVAALATFSDARAQGESQATCAAEAPHNLPLYFADNQTVLTPQAQAMLAKAAQFAQACPTWTAVITLYPGDTGMAAIDQGVANRRLVAVAAVLAKLGLPATRLRLVTAAAPAGPAASSVTGASISFAAVSVPYIAHHFHPGPFPGGALPGPFPIAGPKPPPQVEDYVGSLPKGPLVASSGATAAPPPPVPPGSGPPAPAPTPGPTPNSAAPTPAPAPAPSPNLTVIYNAPPSIPLGQDTNYRLIIETAHSAGASDFTNSPGPLTSHQIPTVTAARVVMTGPPDVVTVQPQSAPCQEVGSLGNPTWNWAVTPKTNKPFYLTVDIYQVADCSAPGVQDVREDTFSIKVTETFWSGLLYEWPAWKSALAWVLGTITAVGGAFGAWTWLKPKKPAKG